jgi:hypothetical protein
MVYPSVAVRLPNLQSPELVLFGVLVHSHPSSDYDCNVFFGIGITILGFTFMIGLMSN